MQAMFPEPEALDSLDLSVWNDIIAAEAIVQRYLFGRNPFGTNTFVTNRPAPRYLRVEHIKKKR
jgi:hypothetical protein